MRLLIISHAFTPGRNPRAFRWGSLAEHWAAKGHEVVVLTAAVPGLPEKEILNGVHVHRVGSRAVERLRGRLTPAVTSPDSSRPPVRTTISPSFRPIILKVVKRLHDLTWKKLYWPDFAALWILPAIREGKQLLDEQKSTVLISVSIPFSSHIVGYFLRRRATVSRWVVDIGDPFAFMVEAPTNNHAIYGGMNFRVEQAVLYAANAISVTTEGTLRLYVATYPQVRDKIFEIPPLANSADSAPAIPPGDDGTTRLVYTGTLHRTIRGPERVLALFTSMLAKQGDMELHFYGNHLEVASAFESLPPRVRQRVFLHGEVSRAEAGLAIRSATALINIGNDTTYQLPSKLVEYAAAGVPVINVVARQNDSSVAFFKYHPCVLNVVGDAGTGDDGAAAALSFLNSVRGRPCAPDPQWLSRFSLGSVARKYEELFQDSDA